MQRNSIYLRQVNMLHLLQLILYSIDRVVRYSYAHSFVGSIIIIGGEDSEQIEYASPNAILHAYRAYNTIVHLVERRPIANNMQRRCEQSYATNKLLGTWDDSYTIIEMSATMMVILVREIEYSNLVLVQNNPSIDTLANNHMVEG